VSNNLSIPVAKMTEAAIQDSDGKKNYPLRIGRIIKIFIYWQRLAVSPVMMSGKSKKAYQ
jgi:hypothetical protein